VNKKRGLLAVREVAERGGGEFFDQIEAMFALWDMQVREQELAGAVATARTLVRDFPDNRELRKFLTIHDPTTLVINPEIFQGRSPLDAPQSGRTGVRSGVA
jgi:hypothetical protein